MFLYLFTPSAQLLLAILVYKVCHTKLKQTVRKDAVLIKKIKHRNTNPQTHLCVCDRLITGQQHVCRSA